MMWIFIALAAYFFWGLVNIGDKYLISQKIKNPYTYLVYLVWAGGLGLLLIPFVDFFVPETSSLFLIAIASTLYFLGSVFYYQAVKIEDISRVNIWWNLIPVFTLIISWLTINEQLTNNQFLAFIILLLGAIIASIHFKKSQMTFSKALPLMIIATVFYASYAVMIRYISQTIPFLIIYIWNLVTVIILTGFLFLAPKFRINFRADTKYLNKKVFLAIMALAVLDELGVLFNMWALSLGPAALIFALEGAQTLFVFLLAVLISLFRPQIIKEELDKRNVILKIVALCVIIVGVIMVNLT